MKTFKIVGDDISDGFHTFDELYEHRCLLFINLVLILGGVFKREHFEGWDCVYTETPYGQISYHVPAKLRPLYENKLIENPDYKYDGHSSTDVITRLRSWAKSGASDE